MIIKNSDLQYKEFYYDNGRILYEGFTYEGKACGYGKLYWPDGNLYQKGVFGIKGLVAGKECYPDGNPKFIGKYLVWTGYGPNPPVSGRYFAPDGRLLYEGKFKIESQGGVGYPKVLIPEGYGSLPQQDSPKDVPFLNWEYGPCCFVNEMSLC